MNKYIRNLIFNLPYYLWFLFSISLFIQAIPTLEMDMWGFDSIYMHKVMFIMMFGEILYLRGLLRTPKKIREKVFAIMEKKK